MQSHVAYALSRGIPGLVPSNGGQPKARFKLEWWSLLGPDGWWPVPYTVDQIFQALAWLMEASWPERDATYTPAGLMRGGGAVRVQVEADFIMGGWPVGDPVRAAREALGRLALSSTYVGPEILEWRERVGITYDRKTRALACRPVWITRPAYSVASDAPLSIVEEGVRLQRLLACAGRGRLLPQLNSCHAGANHPMSVRLSLTQRWGDGATYAERQATAKRRKRFDLAWRFDLRYGFPPPDGSVWMAPLAVQEPGETFVGAMLRAEKALAEMTEADPGRDVVPGAKVRQHLGVLERAAREFGAPPDAIRRGLRWYADATGRHLEAGRREDGGPEWSAVWLDPGPRAYFSRSRDDVSDQVHGQISWPPDLRVDHASGATIDHRGEPVAVPL